MFAFLDISIIKLAQKVKELTLELHWEEMGRILKVLRTRMKREKYKEVLRTFPLSDRTAAYLIAIVTRVDSQMIKVPQGVGWRKMAEVAPLLTYANQAVIFSKVFLHTREELIRMRQTGVLTQS